ncbi:hypothetical protein CES86_3175 [Brucella lupini]|uniref:Uncharacterized protein n=1 Tax=Brucella lupini TaxID=255457 RepID=A0A256GI53_9HYPH|nr:hypothetical protein CES86_3175 [Brucella lupini]
MVLKKNLSADTTLFIVGTGTSSLCCHIWNRRKSSTDAVSGGLARKLASRPMSRR